MPTMKNRTLSDNQIPTREGGDLSIGVIRLVLGSLSVSEDTCTINCAKLRGSRFSRDLLKSTLISAGLVYNDKELDSFLGKVEHLSTSRNQKSKDFRISRAMFSGFNVLAGIVETLLDYDSELMSKVTHASVLSFTRKFQGMEPADAIKLLKYVTSYWLAKHWHDELPESSGFNDPWLFEGMMKQYLRRKVSWRCTRRSSKLFVSLLQCKRCCDEVPGDFVLKAYIKHSETLSRVDPPSIMPTLLMPMIRERVQKILKRFPKFSPKVYEPSHSACFERTRGCGGAAFEVMDAFPEYGLLSIREIGAGKTHEFYGWYSPSSQDLTKETMYREEGLIGEEPEDLLDTVYPGWDDILEDETHPDCKFLRQVWLDRANHKSAGMMTCMVAGIREPLKVRNVTKGRALPYWTVKSVQKWMWRSLKDIPQLKLIGQTANSEIVKEFFKSVEKDPLLVSGDYSAATDNLQIWVTKTIFTEILNRLVADMDEQGRPEEGIALASLCQKVLYEHIIHYPPDPTSLFKLHECLLPSGKVEMATRRSIDKQAPCAGPILQGTGQLMGSPLSFPILCLANLICYWIACQEHDELEDLRVLINGDDIGFGTDPVRYQNWLNMIQAFGFVKSTGKNYVNPRYLVINSTLFDRKAGNLSSEIPYYPTGLLMGRHKVSRGPQSEDDEEEQRPPVLAALELVLRGADNPTRALDAYLAYHKLEVEQVTWKKRNLFLPLERGGCGVKKPEGCLVRTTTRDGLVKMAPENITLWQRKYARWIETQGRVPSSGLTDPNKSELRPYQVVKKVLVPSSHPDHEDLMLKTLKEYREDMTVCSPITYGMPIGHDNMIMRCPLHRREWDAIAQSSPMGDEIHQPGDWMYVVDYDPVHLA